MQQSSQNTKLRQNGVSLIETLVFIVVVSIALGAVVKVFSAAVENSVDPVVRTRALELAQAQLDEILSRKFDENTPSGGVPACNTSAGVPCAGIVADGDYDDVGDFNGYSNTSHPNHTISVIVVEAGDELSTTIGNANARRITVTVTVPGSSAIQLSAYKVNF
ncbi:hypothetical protein TDB9533_02394 [Thalassocella blandensis]|nr:hypothetical protein TDB9533_02394 [Thalassocella blandensis]